MHQNPLPTHKHMKKEHTQSSREKGMKNST